MFSELLNTLVHSSDKVGGHEVHVEFVVIFVVAFPEGVMLFDLRGDEGPEVFDGFIFVVVGVKSLPGIHIHGEFGNITPGIGGFSLFGGLGSGGGLSLLFLFLLFGLLFLFFWLLVLVSSFARDFSKFFSIELSLLL